MKTNKSIPTVMENSPVGASTTDHGKSATLGSCLRNPNKSGPNHSLRHGLALLSALLCLGAVATASAGQQYQFVNLYDYTGTLSPTPPSDLYFESRCINDNGSVGLGGIIANSLIVKNTRWSDLGKPHVQGINASGAAVGYDVDLSTFTVVGWFRSANGDMSSLEFPGGRFTTPYGISDNGTIVGSFTDSAFVFHGFVLDGAGYTQVDYPGAAETSLHGINASGTAVGLRVDADQTRASFILQRNGTFSDLSIPGAASSDAEGINNNGVVCGFYLTPANVEYGYVYDHGKVTTIDASSLLPATFTAPWGSTYYLDPSTAGSSVTGINSRGDIIGTVSAVYDDASGNPRVGLSDQFIGELVGAGQ